MAKVKKEIKAKKNTNILYANVDNKLSILLLVLAFLIFSLVAIAMSDSNSQMLSNASPIKIVVAPSAKPVVKTIKTIKK